MSTDEEIFWSEYSSIGNVVAELKKKDEEIKKWREAAEAKEGYDAGWSGHKIAIGGDPLYRLREAENKLATAIDALEVVATEPKGEEDPKQIRTMARIVLESLKDK